MKETLRDVACDACGGEASPQGEAGRAEPHGPLEGGPAATDEMIARIALPLIAVHVGRRRGGLEGAARDLHFRKLGAAGDLLDRGAVEVACGEIHGGEVAAGTQHIVDRTHRLEQLRPIDIGDQAHAGDDVAHRDVGRALELMLTAHHLVGSRALALQLLLQPAHGGRRLRILVAQALDELNEEALGEGKPLVGRERRRVGDAVVHAHQAVGHAVRLLARRAAAHDAHGRAPQVLDQHDAQRDRHGPQLADAERLDGLVGAHETGQRLRIEPAVGVGDERPGHAEHAGIAGQRTAAQLGELAVVAGRQVGADLADLLFDEMVVVEQPFRGGRDRTALVGGLGDAAVGSQQHAFVVGQAIDQRPG